MKQASIVLICGLAAGVSLMAHGTADASAPLEPPAGMRQPIKAVSFRKDLLVLFRDECTMCHQGEIPMGELNLTPAVAYQNLVRVQSVRSTMDRIAPGNPDRSYLLYKVSGRNALVKGGGFGMPWGASLMPAQVDLVRRWISQGAPNN